MSEMEISRSVAERSLREHMGNVVEALVALTNWTDFYTLDCFPIWNSSNQTKFTVVVELTQGFLFLNKVHSSLMQKQWVSLIQMVITPLLTWKKKNQQKVIYNIVEIFHISRFIFLT